VVSFTPRLRFTPGKGPPVPVGQEAGWVPEPVWTRGLQEISFASAGDRTLVCQAVQSVARPYPAPSCVGYRPINGRTVDNYNDIKGNVSDLF
jgi:hypothetical protein